MYSDVSGTSLVIHLFFSHLCSWCIALPFVPSLPTCISFTVFKYCMSDIQNAPNAINHNSVSAERVYLPPRDEFLTWVSKSLVSWKIASLYFEVLDLWRTEHSCPVSEFLISLWSACRSVIGIFVVTFSPVPSVLCMWISAICRSGRDCFTPFSIP